MEFMTFPMCRIEKKKSSAYRYPLVLSRVNPKKVMKFADEVISKNTCFGWLV